MRDWETVRMILEEIENVRVDGRKSIAKEDIVSVLNSKGRPVSQDELMVLGHRFVIPIVVDAKSLETRMSRLTSDGSRLLDFLRTPEIWSEIESRADRADLRLTPELALLIGIQVASNGRCA